MKLKLTTGGEGVFIPSAMAGGWERGVHAASSSSRPKTCCTIVFFRTRKRPEGRAPGALMAFSLLEVMIAIAIFFTAAFAILSVVAGSLRNAQLLRRPQVDAAAIASVFSTTNSITEGGSSGDLGDLLGDAYRGYTWESAAVECASNKLFEVDFTIYSPDPGHPVYSQICTRFFRPQSPAGSLDGGMGGGMGVH